MTDDHHWDDDFDLDLPDVHVPDLDLGLPDPDHHDPDHHDQVADIPEIAEIPEAVAEAVDTGFPDLLDVGDLPEPIDGFPWIDTATLGAADLDGFTAPTEPVTAQDLAAYAGVELPEGADAWAALSTAEDPATSALARWWTPGEQ